MFLDMPAENEEYRDYMMNYNDPVYNNIEGGNTNIDKNIS
jgi:hypothetical protein